MDKRITLTIKLDPQRDADLVRWWQGLGNGTAGQRGGKNQTALMLLRNALFDTPIEIAQPTVRQQSDLIEENSTLKQLVDQHERDLHALHERLKALEARPVVQVQNTIPDEPEVELTQRLNAKSKAVIKGNLLNTKW